MRSNDTGNPIQRIRMTRCAFYPGSCPTCLVCRSKHCLNNNVVFVDKGSKPKAKKEE
jgi:hypothetical protein